MNDRDEYCGFIYAGKIQQYLLTILFLCIPTAGMAFALAERVWLHNSFAGAAYLVAAGLASIAALGAGYFFWRAADRLSSVWIKLVLAAFTLGGIWAAYLFFFDYSVVIAILIAIPAFFGFVNMPSFFFNTCARWGKDEFGAPLGLGILLYFMLDYFHFGQALYTIGIGDVVFGCVFLFIALLMTSVAFVAVTHIPVFFACCYFLFSRSDLLVVLSPLSMAFLWTLLLLSVLLASVSYYFFTSWEFMAFSESRTTDKGRKLIESFLGGYVPDFSMFKLEGWT